MGMSVTISVATEQDAEQIFRLQYLCFQSEAALYGNYRIDPLVQSLDSVRQEVASDCVFVARLGEEVVGSVRGAVTEDGAAAIGKLCVHPRLQGHGIVQPRAHEFLERVSLGLVAHHCDSSRPAEGRHECSAIDLHVHSSFIGHWIESVRARV